jgi:3',5'-cyclic AMP phosphodiesterase CpdA
MTVLLQLSDPHFGTERPAVVEALVQLTHELAPGIVVLSGDITQRARRSQFRAARTLVDRLGVATVLAIPGNHDIPLFNLVDRLLRPYANHRRCFGPDLEPSVDTDDLLVVCVDTTRRYRHKDGEVSRAQVERVAQRLGRAGPQQLRIVVTHQPVAVTRVEDEHNLLHGREAAVRRWADAGADLVLAGHIHLPFVVALHERFAALPRKLWAVQAGTACSRRLRRGADNSVNVVRADASQEQRQAVVERWDFIAAPGRFQLVARDELRLDANSASCTAAVAHGT